MPMSEFVHQLVADIERALVEAEDRGLTDEEVFRLRKARHSLLLPANELPPPTPDRHAIRYRRGHL